MTFVGIHNRRTDHIDFMRKTADLKPIETDFFYDAMEYFRWVDQWLIDTGQQVTIWLRLRCWLVSWMPSPPKTFYLTTNFTNSALISAIEGAGRIFLPPYAAARFEPTSIELHQTGTFEGHSTNWALSSKSLALAPRVHSELLDRTRRIPSHRASENHKEHTIPWTVNSPFLSWRLPLKRNKIFKFFYRNKCR